MKKKEMDGNKDMKKYEYLVSYHFQKEGVIGYCSGTSQIYRDKKIKSFKDVNGLTKYLTTTIEGASNLAIYNFILLGKVKVEYGRDIIH